MNPTQAKNLGRVNSIEVQTRRKFIRQANEALKLLADNHHAAIKTINSRKTMERARATGFTGNGKDLLGPATSMDTDTAWVKVLKDIEQTRVAMARKLLLAEALLKGEFDVLTKDATSESFYYCEECGDDTRHCVSRGIRVCADCGTQEELD